MVGARVRDGGGWCCPEDGWHGPCEHLRAQARQMGARERLSRAAALSRTGLTGLGVLLEARDPWAEGVLDELLGPVTDDDAAASANARKLLPDPDGAGALAGLVPAGFTRTTPEPVEPAGDDAATAADGDRPGTAGDQTTGIADETDDTGGDGEGGGGSGRAWSRALRRSMAGVFDPGAEEDTSALGVGVDVLAGMRGSADLAAVLTGTDTATLPRVAGIEVLAAHRRVEAWAAGQAAVAAAGLSRAATFFHHPRLPRPVDVTAEEIAMRLALSRAEAKKLVQVGQGLTRTFTETAAALDAGVIDFRRATTIVTSLAASPVPVAVQVEREVLEEADGRTAAQLRRDLAKALIAVDPEDARDRHARARAGRHVNHTRTLPDGMGSIYAVMPAEDCVQVDLTLDAIAHGAKNDGDTRTIDQLRADALLALTHAALITGHTGPPDHETGNGSGPAVPTMPGAPPRTGMTPPGATTPLVNGNNDHPRTTNPAPGAGSAMHDPRCGNAPPGALAPRTAPTVRPAPGETPAGAPPEDSLDDAPDASAPDRNPGGSLLDRAPQESPPDRAPEESPPDGSPPDSSPPEGVVFPPLHQLLLRSSERFVVPDIRVHVTVPLAGILPPDEPAPDTGIDTGPAAQGTAAPTDTPDTTGAEAARSAGPTDAVADDDAEPLAEVAHLEGYGPITPDLARALAAGGTWRRLVTDPVTGTVTHLGRTVYRPPAALQALVRARDITCVRPACTVPARRAQIDHTKAFSAGGTTDLDQLGSMCRRDHTTKTVGAFKVTQPEPGIFVWVTPTGHTYRREPNGTVTLTAVQPPHDGTPEPLHVEDDPPPPF